MEVRDVVTRAKKAIGFGFWSVWILPNSKLIWLTNIYSGQDLKTAKSIAISKFELTKWMKNCLDFYRLLSSCGESIWGNISWSIFKPLFSSPLSSKEMKTSVWEKFMSQNLKDRVFRHITKLKEFARSFSTKAALYFSSLWNPVNVISSNKV